jgi:transcriptional regulator ATRX
LNQRKKAEFEKLRKLRKGQKRRCKFSESSSTSDNSDAAQKKKNEDDGEDAKDSSVIALSSDSDFEYKPKKTAAKKPRRARVVDSSDSDSDVDTSHISISDSVKNENEEDAQSSQGTPKGRRNIKKIIKEKDLGADTRTVMSNEKERLRRLEEKKKVVDEIVLSDGEAEATEPEKEAPKPLILDVDKATKVPTVSVHPTLVKFLKPHQRKGIRFMFDATVESVEEAKNPGGGAILAHCMGLGKTLQVITLIHTLYSNEHLDFRRFLVLCPKNTVLNWAQEFRRWLDEKKLDEVEVFKLEKEVKYDDKMFRVRNWFKRGGVLLLSYSEFRPLANPENKRISAKTRKQLQEYLIDPGPDFVICDEGHVLKNEKTALFKVSHSFSLLLFGVSLLCGMEKKRTRLSCFLGCSYEDGQSAFPLIFWHL